MFIVLYYSVNDLVVSGGHPTIAVALIIIVRHQVFVQSCRFDLMAMCPRFEVISTFHVRLFISEMMLINIMLS